MCNVEKDIIKVYEDDYFSQEFLTLTILFFAILTLPKMVYGSGNLVFLDW